MNTTDTKAKILWIELIKCGHGYSLPRDDNDEPYAFESHAEALENHLEDKKHHEEQVKTGERDSDDEYEWELTPVHIKGDMMEILDPDNDFSVITSFNWKLS